MCLKEVTAFTTGRQGDAADSQHAWEVFESQQTGPRAEGRYKTCSPSPWALHVVDQMYGDVHQDSVQDDILRHLTSVPPASAKHTVPRQHHGVFVLLHSRDRVCRPRLRHGKPPTVALQSSPPTAAKGSWLGLHRGAAAKRNFTASWAHGGLDAVRNGLMHARFHMKLRKNLLHVDRTEKKRKEKNNSGMLTIIPLHMTFPAFAMAQFD